MVRTVKLQNGVQVVMENIDALRSVALGVFIRCGSRHEGGGESGVSHFIEHMLFKGTARRTAAQIAEEMDAIGGQLNAYTTKEYTCYYSLCLDTHFDTALDVLSDMFFNSCFDEAEMKKELNVILEEINMYEDTPEELVHDILQESVWRGEGLGRSILGEAQTISSLSREALTAYFSARYRPENTVIALAGSFDADEAVNKLEQRFCGVEWADGQERAYTPEPVRYVPCLVTREKDIEQIHLSMGFPGMRTGSPDAYVMAALNAIFGSGMSSRLFQTIRETHGLAYAVYSYNSSFTDTGLFSVYAGMNPACTEKVIELILAEAKRLFTDAPTKEQLSKTKEQLKSGYFLSLESSVSRMNSIGRSQLLLDRVLGSDEVIDKIDAVTLDDFGRVAVQTLDMERLSLSAVGPVGGMDFTEMINRAK